MFQHPCLPGSRMHFLQIFHIFAALRSQLGMLLPSIPARCAASSHSLSCLARHDYLRGSPAPVVWENSHGLLISVSTLAFLVDTSVGYIYSKLSTPRVFFSVPKAISRNFLLMSKIILPTSRAFTRNSSSSIPTPKPSSGVLWKTTTVNKFQGLKHLRLLFLEKTNTQ